MTMVYYNFCRKHASRRHILPAIVNVDGTHLERAPSLVRDLKGLECDDHFELADVYLIVAEDGSVQAQHAVHCCVKFRATAQKTIDDHNEAIRPGHGFEPSDAVQSLLDDSRRDQDVMNDPAASQEEKDASLMQHITAQSDALRRK
jgi:hypothetical protein